MNQATSYLVGNYGSPMTTWNTFNLWQITRTEKFRAVNRFQCTSFAAVKAESDRLRSKGVLVTWDCGSAPRGAGEAALCHCTNCGRYHLAGDDCPRAFDSQNNLTIG
jgi:hypothetical protein